MPMSAIAGFWSPVSATPQKQLAIPPHALSFFYHLFEDYITFNFTVKQQG